MLRKYEGKRVTLSDVDGKSYSGIVGDYIFPEDNEPSGEEALILDIIGCKYPIQFNASEIKTIILEQ